MPRYEIRNTANDALSYVEGALPLDLAALLPNGTYRARVMSDEEPTNIVISTTVEISNLSPADNATDVTTSANLVITFNKAMARQGTVDLRNVGGALIESFNLATEGVWSSGDTVWTGDPADLFANSASLCVRWSGLQDTLGNTIANNTGDTAWNFTVEAAPAGAITATYLSTVSVDWTPDFGTLSAGWYAVLVTQRNTDNPGTVDSITPPGQSAVLPIEQAKGNYNTGGVISAIFFVELTAERSGSWTLARTGDGFETQCIISLYSLSAEPAVPAANEKATLTSGNAATLSVNTIAGNDVLVLQSILDAVEPTDGAGDLVVRDSSTVVSTSVRQQTFSGTATGGTPEAVYLATPVSMAFKAHSAIAVALRAA